MEADQPRLIPVDGGSGIDHPVMGADSVVNTNTSYLFDFTQSKSVDGSATFPVDVRLPGNLSDKELIKKYTQVQHLVSPEARAKGKTEIKRVPKEDLDAFKQAWSECRTKPEKDKVWARFFRPLAEVLKADTDYKKKQNQRPRGKDKNQRDPVLPEIADEVNRAICNQFQTPEGAEWTRQERLTQLAWWYENDYRRLENLEAPALTRRQLKRIVKNLP